jgi:hypothetical protein
MTNDQSSTSATGTATPGGYEFGATEELIIGELASAMRFVGTASVALAIVMWVIGIVTMFAGNPAGLGNIIQGVLLVFIGVWTRSSAKSFQLVVDTQGNDIPNLMQALSELRRLYNLQKWLMVLGLVLVLAAFALGVAAALFLMPHH